ncbi:hypothetical protein C0Q70_01735 [Pomacea canaliculata]|uniref:Uncharacterized protein n=1 Tax=Pomacea canaliculata TaxID=400727 RepID=A0A2T7Q0E0_POMCA|nr:hypothetical protein C0Q70_01735 [Pomacea canaliculata]
MYQVVGDKPDRVCKLTARDLKGWCKVICGGVGFANTLTFLSTLHVWSYAPGRQARAGGQQHGACALCSDQRPPRPRTPSLLITRAKVGQGVTIRWKQHNNNLT